MHVILGKPPHTSSSSLRDQLGWTTLHERRQRFMLTQVHKCLLNLAPPYLTNKFKLNSTMYTGTRGSGNIYLYRPTMLLRLATQTLTDLSSMEKGLSSETKNSPDTQPLHAAHLQSGEQPTSSEGQSEDMGPWTGATEEPSSRTRTLTQDEEDFDKFLESVKAQQLSLSTKVPEPHPSLSDSEEEIDFGFWEKASTLPSDKTPTMQGPELVMRLSHN
ncbi:uncharacterized protein LOC135352017 isoform X1 [Halichondria panicea]|uniref:uncharacterized protein LOC135352017 isoform X1 n=1 Tax=Halichondria panicea TaxID=6063 RepID=UPI00312B66E4